MKRQELLDLYFMDARSKLIDLAAFLDRLERSEGEADFRLDAFRQAMRELEGGGATRAKNVLLAFSDPTTEPLATAPGKGACGAWPGPAVNSDQHQTAVEPKAGDGLRLLSLEPAGKNLPTDDTDGTDTEAAKPSSFPSAYSFHSSHS